MNFFVGLHHASMCGKRNDDGSHKIRSACISINTLRGRKKALAEPEDGWMLDSGAFTEISTHGRYRFSAEQYAREAAKWVSPKLKVVVAQDYMCEPFILGKTGLTVAEHQRLTVERYDDLLFCWDILGKPWWPPIMPVLQGWTVDDYLSHIDLYGRRLEPGMWVGVGSVCKRQGSVETIEAILTAIKAKRPDLRLHGFGVKLTALRSPVVRALLHSADSMAWSFSARKQGRDANSVDEAAAFVDRVEAMAA